MFSYLLGKLRKRKFLKFNISKSQIRRKCAENEIPKISKPKVILSLLTNFIPIPKGKAKLTLLNLLSGLLTPTAGRVYLDGDDVTALSGRARRVSQVFQFPVLYEAMTVADNLAFPLRTRRMAPAEIGRRVAAVAEALGLTDALKVRPRGLSLYQKQLVAVGKALTRPDVSLVLLDEPLTAVEPRVKWDLRRVLKAVQAELGVTMIYVTHDQTEALTFADRVSVVDQGRILQTGTPDEIYQSPAHVGVASLIGSPAMNLLDGTITGGSFRCQETDLLSGLSIPDGPCQLGVRPEWITFHPGDSWQQLSSRPLGTRDGELHLLTRLQRGETQLTAITQGSVEAHTDVGLSRYVLFRQGEAITVGQD